MIAISERAVQELQRAIADHKQQEPEVGEVYVRIGVKGGGCSGYQYTLSLDEGVTEKDEIFEVSGLKVAVDNRSALYLEGTALHFLDELNRRGFKFSNPNAKNTCGCGSSFSM